MPIFGYKSTFAVEAEHWPLHPKYIFGNICFWIGGKQFGDYGQTVILGAPALILGDALVFQGQRWDESVDGKSKEDALAFLEKVLYGRPAEGVEKTDAEIIRLLECYCKF